MTENEKGCCRAEVKREMEEMMRQAQESYRQVNMPVCPTTARLMAAAGGADAAHAGWRKPHTEIFKPRLAQPLC